jgi:two-component system response regulator HydG
MAHYFGHMSERTRTSPGPLAPETLDFLMRYTWPGNVRELRNVVEALFIDLPSGPICVSHLPPNLVRAAEAAIAADPPERARILSALLATRWNKCRAAEQLHWSRMTLYRKMAKHGIVSSSRS